MTSYYDLILSLIPLALFGISGLLTVAGFQLTVAAPSGALVAGGMIGHAMFVNGPVESRTAQSPAPSSTASIE